MSAHTETSLKALTVPKLKELLVAAGLSVTGKKDELISRILEAPTVPLASASPAPADPSPAVPTPAAEPTPVITAAETASAETPAPTPAPVELTAEEKAAKASAEEEKRKARAARFGQPDEEKKEEKKDDVLSKRAEKYGTGKKVEEKPAASVEKLTDRPRTLFSQSLEALDRPLGEKKARAPKAAVVAATTTPAAEKKAPAAPKAAPKEVDPELQKKLADEEEKKRKRAERFGAPAAPELNAPSRAERSHAERVVRRRLERRSDDFPTPPYSRIPFHLSRSLKLGRKFCKSPLIDLIFAPSSSTLASLSINFALRDPEAGLCDAMPLLATCLEDLHVAGNLF
ncbi:SAP domain-containing ribonucleoprotein, partial [Phenoliferia sp. Uapishka_3]